MFGCGVSRFPSLAPILSFSPPSDPSQWFPRVASPFPAIFWFLPSFVFFSVALFRKGSLLFWIVRLHPSDQNVAVFDSSFSFATYSWCPVSSGPHTFFRIFPTSASHFLGCGGSLHVFLFLPVLLFALRLWPKPSTLLPASGRASSELSSQLHNISNSKLTQSWARFGKCNM